ncbi:MAG: MFS transporter [Anaerolineales bacterium]|nr:MFS transporter [Anaerolineales bacterium]
MKKVWPFSMNFLFFASFAFIGPFTVLYYQSLGFSGAQIGVLIGLTPLITLLSAPLWTGLADSTHQYRLILSGVLLAGAVGVFGFPFLHTFVPILLLALFFNMFFSPVMSFTDSATMFMLGERKELYGRIRVGGTIGFGLASLIAGTLVQSYGLKSAFWGSSLLIFLCLFVSQKLEYHEAQEKTSLRHGARILLQNRQWLLFLTMAFAGGLNLAATNNYLLPYLKELGMQESIMGIVLMVGTLSEIPILFFGNRLIKQFQPYKLFVLTIIFSGIRLLLFAIVPALWLVFPIQLLNGMSYPAMWMAGVAYADENAPPGLHATAQGLFGATVSGIGTAVGGFFDGLMLESIGGRGMYMVMGIILLFIVGLVTLLGKRPSLQSQ